METAFVLDNLPKEALQRYRDAAAKGKRDFIGVPIGHVRMNVVGRPAFGHEGVFPRMRYQQGEKDMCFLMSLANALHYFGMKTVAHQVSK